MYFFSIISKKFCKNFFYTLYIILIVKSIYKQNMTLENFQMSFNRPDWPINQKNCNENPKMPQIA